MHLVLWEHISTMEIIISHEYNIYIESNTLTLINKFHHKKSKYLCTHFRLFSYTEARSSCNFMRGCKKLHCVTLVLINNNVLFPISVQDMNEYNLEVASWKWNNVCSVLLVATSDIDVIIISSPVS